MGFKKKTSVRSSGYGGMLVFGTLATGLLTVTLGPIGLVGGIIATGVGLKGVREDAKDRMNEVFTSEDENALISAHENKDEFHSELTYKNKAGNPFLSRILFGNDITVKNKYTKK